jgi:hypothetical protein
VNAAALPRGRKSPSPRVTRRRRLLAALFVLLALGTIVGVRAATRPTSTVADTGTPHYVPVPDNPAIDQAWGIQIKQLILGADRGILDMRYQVVNVAKSARIHGGATANADPTAATKALPTFIRESDGLKITPQSAMMHFEHFHFQSEKLGSTYSILYGNSGGLLHVGDKVTIRMADGLEIKHAVVAN